MQGKGKGVCVCAEVRVEGRQGGEGAKLRSAAKLGGALGLTSFVQLSCHHGHHRLQTKTSRHGPRHQA